LLLDCALPFNIVERACFKCFAEKVCPKYSSQLPGRTTVKKLLGAAAASRAQDGVNQLTAMEFSKGHQAGMVVDRWSNVNKVHIKGIMMTVGTRSGWLQPPWYCCGSRMGEAYF
jgi:hypothetical protein